METQLSQTLDLAIYNGLFWEESAQCNLLILDIANSLFSHRLNAKFTGFWLAVHGLSDDTRYQIKILINLKINRRSRSSISSTRVPTSERRSNTYPFIHRRQTSQSQIEYMKNLDTYCLYIICTYTYNNTYICLYIRQTKVNACKNEVFYAFHYKSS